MAAGSAKRKRAVNAINSQLTGPVPPAQAAQAAQAATSQGQATQPAPVLTANGQNTPPKLPTTINSFYTIMTNSCGNKLRLNIMTQKVERLGPDGQWIGWTDGDEADLRSYCEEYYHLYNREKFTDALRVYIKNHKVNPLLDILKKLTWDGTPRIESFLHDVMKAEDNAYTRECSRLLFAGGIHRAYNPGCKFDTVLVLIGSQAAGKSTIVRWLNIDDQFFREIKTISGKEGVEALFGCWIGEIAELMAMTRVKEQEAVKAYITSQEDSYRTPYDKYTQTIQRRCIFVATTNDNQFLSDRTGNRRWLPVEVKSTADELYKHKDEIQEYIRQCWAEAIQLYQNGNLPAYPDPAIIDQMKQAQEYAMEDDWRVGAIRQYLDDQKIPANSTVCVIEVWHNALNEPAERKPTRKDSIEIGRILNSMDGWVRNDKPVRTVWGLQKVWRKDNFAALWKK